MADFRFLRSSVVKHANALLVCGVTDVQILKRLLAETKLSLQKATEIALGMEAAAKNAQTLQPTMSKGNAQDESLHKVQTGFRKIFF